MNCPKCNSELDYDEVDIGVGVLKGNYRCPNSNCDWTEKEEREIIDSLLVNK
jgi:hypothetical protein